MCENEFKKISLKKFLSTFIDEDKSETRFCFILGAGASKQSGIPTGGELAKKWMEEIEESCDNEELEIINKWKIEKNITKETLAEHYTEIYDKRFEVDPKLGYTELERLMEDKEPSCGYSFLSQVLTKTKHNVVITTNFDSLTEDALFIYTQMKPIVCGHESLANFATPLWKRPLIIKVHRDVFFAPKSSPEQTKAIDGGWTEKLKNIFQNFIPIVIGYGGNDGSLIGLLDKIDKIPGIYWCYRKDNEPNGKIKKLVSTLNGWFIPIDGFDEMMIQLNNVLGFGLLDEKVKEVSNKRIENYRKQIEDINKRAKNEETEDALKSIVLKTKRNWWHIQMEVDAVNDKNEKQRIYEKGLKEFPDSYELRGEYAIFLHQEQKDYDSAEQQYKKVLEHEPDNITILGAYAILLYNIRNKNDEAEKLIIKAMNIKPDNALSIINYAIFLVDGRKNINDAKKYFEKALDLDPKNITIIGYNADFLSKYLKEYEKAEKLYRKILEVEPVNVEIIGNYANVLMEINKNYDQAEELYKKILDIDPTHCNTLGNYARLLLWKGNMEKAKEYIEKAFASNKENQDLMCELWFYRYAHFPEYYEIGKQKLEELINAGVKSIGWNLKPNIEIAKKAGHPEIETLEKFAKQITEP